MLIASATQKMIEFYQGSCHDINHFLKVWAFAKTIGELEGLDSHTQTVLELTALVHDIACPLCREKYGNTDGKNQERESPPLVEKFFRELPVAREDVTRISWLVAHHHTYTGVEGMDYTVVNVNHRLRGYHFPDIVQVCGHCFVVNALFQVVRQTVYRIRFLRFFLQRMGDLCQQAALGSQDSIRHVREKLRIRCR